MIAGDYSPTTTSLVRPPRRRPPAQGAQPGVPIPAGGIQPYMGNGVLPQPPAAAIPSLLPTGQTMFNSRVAPPTPTPVPNVPAPAAPPVAALPPNAPPGATAIDPNANLRGAQINPVNAADTGAARAGLVGETQRITNRATPRVGFQGVNPNVAGGPAVDPATSARLAAQQSMVDEQSQKLAGVDRLKLAQEQFGTYAKATDPEFQATIRDATEAAAAHGGLGSGMLTTRYGTLAGDRANALTTERDRLFQTATEGSIQDQFSKVAALQGLSGQTAGEEAGVRGERRTERDTATGLGERNVGRTQQERDSALGVDERNVERGMEDDYRKVGAAQDLFGTLSGADRGERDEYRAERSNQQDEAQRAEDSGVRRAQLQAALEAGDFEQALALAQYGDAGNPGAATIGVGAQQSAQGSDDLQGILQLLQQYGYNRATKPKAA